MSKDTQKTFSKQTAKFLAVLGENLPALESSVMQGWIQNPKALQKFLVGLDQSIIKGPASLVQTWRTLTIGGVSAEQLYNQLSERGHFYGGHKSDDDLHAMMFDKAFTTLPTPHVVRLVQLTPQEMGFVKEPTLYPLLERAKELGLSWHVSIAPHLRLDYFDESEGPSRYVPTEPLKNNDDEPAIFGLDHNDDGFWLWESGHTDWSSDTETTLTHHFPLTMEMVFIIGQPEPIES